MKTSTPNFKLTSGGGMGAPFFVKGLKDLPWLWVKIGKLLILKRAKL